MSLIIIKSYFTQLNCPFIDSKVNEFTVRTHTTVLQCCLKLVKENQKTVELRNVATQFATKLTRIFRDLSVATMFIVQLKNPYWNL